MSPRTARWILLGLAACSLTFGVYQIVASGNALQWLEGIGIVIGVAAFWLSLTLLVCRALDDD